MSEYTKHVGEKFHEDGSIRYFPGATIISPLESSNPMHPMMTQIQTEASGSHFAGHLSFLPPSSFHMTVFELYSDFNRDSPKWSSKIDSLLPANEVNTLLFNAFKSVDAPLDFVMEIDYVDINSIKLKPATEKTQDDLKKYRNALSEASGIRFPNHDTYQFHMTYSYLLKTLHEEIAMKRFIASQTQWIKKLMPTFTIGKPEFCLYSSMESFVPYQ